MLAALVLRAPALVTYGQLLDDVWGTEPPGTGHRVLPSYVYALRKTLDAADAGPARSVLQGGPGGYRILSGDVRTDLADLAEQAALAQRAKAAGDLDAALDHGDRALELFHGEPLTGLPGPLADSERHRLAAQHRVVRQDRAECLVLLGRYGDALDDLVVTSLAHPHDEPLAALRMRALYGIGRQAEALTVYRETRHRLLDELGVEPGEDLRRVHQAVLRRDGRLLLGRAAGPREDTASAGGGTRRRDSLPVQRRGDGSGGSGLRRNELPGDTACLVGREAELALLTAPVPPGAVSVLTIDGTAGVGKTALVVRAAWALGDAYPDGCLFVDLHAYGAAHESVGPQRALRRMLRAVRGPGGDEPLGAVSDVDDPDDPDDVGDLVTAWRAATSGLRLLLVVDNARSAEQVRPLLPAGPGSRVLVAGRQRLSGLDADLRLTVEPLGPGDAVGLFRELLGESRADREPEAARELARRCGGLPLALRIASARLQNRPSWTLAFLADRMSDDVRSLGELRAEDRSVEAAFRMSYDQLAPELRRGFRALGMAPTARFDGLALAAMLGRSREEAEDVLEDLVDASLLAEPHPGRYRLHDLVRAHARRLAAETPEQAGADRAAVLRLYAAAGRIAGDWGPEAFPTGEDVTGSPFAGWAEASAWLDAAGGDLVDVVAYAAAAGEFDHACWIAEALVDHLVRQGHFHECRTALDHALACADTATDRRMPSSLRVCMGIVDVYQGRFRQARTWFTEALRYARCQGDPRDQARAIAGLGAATWPLGGTKEALTHLTEALELADGLGDDWLTGMANCNLGAIHSGQGRHEQALDHYATALALAEKNGRPRTISSTLCFAADAQLALGRHVEATSLLRRAAELAREAEDLPLRAAGLSRLASVEHERGDLRSAVDTHHEALSTLTRHTSTWLEMGVRIRLGSTYAAAGRHTEARQEFRTALSLPGAGDHPREYAMARDGLTGISPPHTLG
ncbi:BTAD domain-containing putative transcriptional regulator [Streptomyces sp. NBC_00094]|uniref:AfsR/SARP family transcriptional regulator n=1 Tax=Streptomyces sp. NBC_00094 TaxID=2903620 RepID=UPI002254D980|nr:BTAD domain-containing putative transcriptional regulator [Streptomyces sp. NBC_00094]MCX5394706.1 tetratricopeptide repeat protein [Streptomyces sp. NBC_00094]